MQLSSLSVSDLRNLQPLHLDLHPHFNIIWGENGSGKTSLLEAIHVLATGRSFRANHARQIIAFGKAACITAGVVASSPVSSQKNPDTFSPTIRMGVERFQNGGIKIRLAEKDCSSIAELAQVLPLQLINSESYGILEAAPQYRRQFLDWILFHVEHSFYPVWQRFKRVLQQRNAALKAGLAGTRASIAAWDKELIETGELIHQQRKIILEELIPIFIQSLGQLLKIQKEVKIQYRSGWGADISLEQAVSQSLERDLAWGYTMVGPQRADLEFWIDGVPAKSLLSRGQLKLFICALLMARANLLAERQGRRCLFLIDDLGSELDHNASGRLLEGLFELGGQVVITSIEGDPLAQLLGDRASADFQIKAGELVG